MIWVQCLWAMVLFECPSMPPSHLLLLGFWVHSRESHPIPHHQVSASPVAHLLVHYLGLDHLLLFSISYWLDFPGRVNFTFHNPPSLQSFILSHSCVCQRPSRPSPKLFFCVGCPFNLNSYEMGQYFLNLLLLFEWPFIAKLSTRLPLFLASPSLWLRASSLFPACPGPCTASAVRNWHFKALLQDIKGVYKLCTEGLWQFASFILINSTPLPSLIPSSFNSHLVFGVFHLF